MRKRILCGVSITVIVLTFVVQLTSCKSCNKTDSAQSVPVDTASTSKVPQGLTNTMNLPHADSSLAPILTKAMDNIFDASKGKDYNKLASYIVYRGPDMKRFGYDVFNAKNAYEKAVVKITADVFNKWNTSCETREYARIFSLPQPDGRDMTVMEVLFISKRGVSREFFGFLPTKDGDFKLVDVTSNLSVQ